jgi:hypothetical protein
LFSVLAHGAVGRKLRGQARHAFPHPRHPGRGDALLVAGIKFSGSNGFCGKELMRHN